MSSPAIRLICPNLKCRTVLSVPPSARGKNVRCRQCGSRIQVPSAPKPVAPSVAQATDNAPPQG